ncbi:hypothetical protein M9458_050476, partial [Cirrhinus mrigala]
WIMNDSRKHRRIYVDREAHSLHKQRKSTASSAAQMSGVNDDHYVHYYIQQHNTSIAQLEIYSCLTYIPAPASTHGKLLDCDSWSKVRAHVNQLLWERPLLV